MDKVDKELTGCRAVSRPLARGDGGDGDGQGDGWADGAARRRAITPTSNSLALVQTPQL